MASKRAVRRAVLKRGQTEDDARAIADRLYRSSVRLYQRSLRELAKPYDVQVDAELSPDLKSALREEADRVAAGSVRAFNSDLELAGERLRPKPLEQVASGLDEYAAKRRARQADVLAITQSYATNADAALGFVQDADAPEPLFDFGGHPELGDKPPECALCQVIYNTNPHTLADVKAIGTPHPRCRQSWHYASGYRPPQTVDAGNTLGGIIGRDSLVSRAGGLDEAVSAVLALRG